MTLHCFYSSGSYSAYHLPFTTSPTALLFILPLLFKRFTTWVEWPAYPGWLWPNRISCSSWDANKTPQPPRHTHYVLHLHSTGSLCSDDTPRHIAARNSFRGWRLLAQNSVASPISSLWLLYNSSCSLAAAYVARESVTYISRPLCSATCSDFFLLSSVANWLATQWNPKRNSLTGKSFLDNYNLSALFKTLSPPTGFGIPKGRRRTTKFSH